jgi:hypothetical protein
MDGQFEALATTTLRKYAEKTLADNVFQFDPLYAYLMAKGRAKGLDGGEYIVEPLMYGKNSTANSFRGYDVLDVTPQDGIARAIFDWAQAYVSITISGRERNLNKGDSAVINLLEAKFTQAEESLREEMVDQLYSDGTGNAGKDITGMRAVMSETGSYGSIDPATYTWWLPTHNASLGTLTVAGLRTLINDVRGSGGKAGDSGKAGVVDLIVMTQALYEAWETLYEAKIRLTGSDTKLGELGFDAMKYKGAEVTWSDHVPEGTIWALSTKYMSLKYHKDVNFATTPFVRPANQDATTAQVLWMGNLTTSNRRRLGYAAGATA